MQINAVHIYIITAFFKVSPRCGLRLPQAGFAKHPSIISNLQLEMYGIINDLGLFLPNANSPEAQRIL